MLAYKIKITYIEKIFNLFLNQRWVAKKIELYYLYNGLYIHICIRNRKFN